MSPVDDRAAPSELYWLVSRCMCGRKIRGSALLREWHDHKKPSFDDVEAIVTTSSGPKKIVNTHTPLGDFLRAKPYGERAELYRTIERFFATYEQRLFVMAREARTMGLRVRAL